VHPGCSNAGQQPPVRPLFLICVGEECRALGALCKRFSIPFLLDEQAGYVDYNDLFTDR
jgi:hypothetical protein